MKNYKLVWRNENSQELDLNYGNTKIKTEFDDLKDAYNAFKKLDVNSFDFEEGHEYELCKIVDGEHTDWSDEELKSINQPLNSWVIKSQNPIIMKNVNLNLGMYEQRLSSDLNKLQEIFAYADDVQLYDVSKSFNGHGHYRINLELIINGITKKFTTVIDTMTVIDDWNDEDGNVTSETIMYVIGKFEDQIDEYLIEISEKA